MLQQRHLLGLEGYPAADIQTIIDTAFKFREVLDRPIKKVPSLQGVTIVNLFFENSTRTRISFELAQKRLSADTVNFSASSSSLKKGESFKDTAQNIEAMKIDAVVMRHPSPGAPKHLTEFIDSVVINAGDGIHEHPTQAILDMMSLHEKFGKLNGLKVGIIGDISHSRVALSNIYGLQIMGAEVTLCGPTNLIPPFIRDLGVTINTNIDEVIEEYDQRNKDSGWTEVNTTFENTEIGVSDSDYFGEGSFDQSIQMWIDKNKIESLTQQVESLNQKIKQGETK